MPSLANVGRFIAQNPNRTALLGAGLGAAANVGREALTGGPDKSYLRAGIHGAVAGGVIGGGAHGIAHAAHDTMLLRPELQGAGAVAKGTLQRAGQGVSNFAQRQVHGLTGYGSKDTAYLDRIGVAGSGTSMAKNRLGNLRAESMATHNPAKAGEIFDEAGHAARAVASEGMLGDRMRGLGMTSAPGAVKAMATNPREATKAIWSQLKSGGKMGIAAGTVLPGALAAGQLSRGDERATGGQGIPEKALRAGANIGGGLLFGGLPIASNMVASMGAEAAAGRLGRAITPQHTNVAGIR